MKHSRYVTALSAAMLAFCIAWGAGGCLASAFDLALAHPVGLVFGLGVYTCFAVWLLSLRHGGTVLLCLWVLACGYLYHDGTAARQLLQLLQQLSTVYDRAYGWGILQLADEGWGPACFDWPVGILGTVISTAVAWSVCGRKRVWLPVVVTVLPLCSCIVVTDTVPGEIWLLMVVAGLILLVLPSSVRQENALQGLRLTVGAALPVVLALLALFLILPQKGYVNHSEDLLENLSLTVRNIPQLVATGGEQLSAGIRRSPPRQVDLAGLGARIPFTYPVMEVTAEAGGTLYLREQSYDSYDGLGWAATDGREEVFSPAAEAGETITIQTRSRKTFRYLPYYPSSEIRLRGGVAENPDGKDTYSFHRSDLPEDWRQRAYGSGAEIPEQWQEYLSLPEAARQGAEALLKGIFSETASNTEKADIIAALVTDSARYDLAPGKMPAGQEDFALWFLREAEAGYCVHFATAATVLLRAAGVPARYVTGYMVEAQPGHPVTVTEENAHAWAEYYEPNLDLWLLLEATPAGEREPVRAVAQISPTVEEQPETTAGPAGTEAVTEESLPRESVPEITVPDEMTEALEPEVPPAEEKTGSLWPLLLLLAVSGLLALQRWARITLRRTRYQTGTTNQQALQRWREALRLARLLRESPTEELIVLAQKAKFSQHILTVEEVLQFDSFIRSCLRRLKKRPWYLRLIYRYVYAVY